ncbi:hypothetical protein [Paraburkholderia tropica]|uniref:hypothetical protein n=1 Tax=Paraburkholderia tropica TaxID=92647 RepID=UPI0031D19FC0
MTSSLTSRPFIAEDTPILPWDNGNPLLANVPLVPSLAETLYWLEEKYDSVDLTGLSPAEIVLRQCAHVHIPRAEEGAALRLSVAMVRDSLRDRDLRFPDYRDYVWASHNLLHRKRGTLGHNFPATYAIAPRAKSRGIVVAMPVRMGRTTFANSVESFMYEYEADPQASPRAQNLTRAPVITRVESPHGFAEHMQLKCLRMHWPVDGTPAGFTESFLGAFNNKFQTDYSSTERSPLFRGRYAVPSLCSLAAVSHLGLLIIERVNYENVQSLHADTTWGIVGHFTKLTGIPVLIIITTGAAAYSLSHLPGVIGDLAPAGVIEIRPPKHWRDPHWIAICNSLFDATLGALDMGEMPAWLPQTAFEITWGYPSLLARALRSIALFMLTVNTFTFDESIFRSYATQACVLDSQHLNAIGIIRQKGVANPSRLWRHSDWLTFNELSLAYTVPTLN